MKNDREYRSMTLSLPDESFIVEGYASTFEPYVLFEEDGIKYSERILPTAFEGTDLSDVVFRIDHEGRVYARTSAGTVRLDVDEKGLHNVTDLSTTERAKEIYYDIKAGNYPQMSFAFIVDDDEYERETHTRIIRHIKKVFDISPVTFPANPTTSISARDWFNGVIEAEKAERLEREKRERQKQRIRILAEV